MTITTPTGVATGQVADLVGLLDHDAPQGFVPHVLLDDIARICHRLGLSTPRVWAGNIVVGDPATATIVLSAHLDEASFSVITADTGSAVTLAACHRLPPSLDHLDLRFTGVRDGHIVGLGQASAEVIDGQAHATIAADIRLGDRAVYRHPTRIEANLLTAKAIDDRTGAVIALHAAHQLLNSGVPVAVVLSDGEQNRPEGYFSRTFPHVLATLTPQAMIIFVDGIFDGLAREGITDPPTAALVVPHSGDGAGYTVAPYIFAALRDQVIPAAAVAGIDVRVSSAYHSRGDDWGMVTNPTCGVDHDAFFVSFAGAGTTPAHRTIDLRCLSACIDFVAFAATELGQPLPRRLGNESV